MLRLLARVEKIKNAGSFVGEDGLERSSVYCLARIRSAARSGLKMPRGLRGKTVRITRTYIHPWRVELGDMVVLDPEESEAAVRKHLKVGTLGTGVQELGSKKARTVSHDSDGLKKYVIENAFMRSVISPDYGARVEKLYNLGTGRNELYAGYNYGAQGYVEMGGVEESLSRVGKPADHWNADFKLTRTKEADFSFRHSSKKKEGLEEHKSFLLVPDAPLLCQFTRFEFSPRRSGKDEGKKRMELNYVPRIFFGIAEKSSYTNLFFVPTEEQLVEQRYNAPAWETRWGGGIWDWRKKWHAVKPGFVLLADEETGECMAVFMNSRELNFAWIGRNRLSPRLYLSHRPREMKPGEKVEYSLGFSAGVAYDLTKNSLLLVARGSKGKQGIPLSVIYRTSLKCGTPRVRFSHDGEEMIVKLEKRQVKGVGRVFLSSFTVDSEPREYTAELEVSGEHLCARGVKR